MKKLLLVYISSFLVFAMISCRHRETYQFLTSNESISEVSIVLLSFDSNNELVQTNINVIDNIEEFIAELSEVECYTNYGDPSGVTEEGVDDTAIKITYQNEEYELINWCGQSKYTLKKGFRYYAGYSLFDKCQFEALIDKYTL